MGTLWSRAQRDAAVRVSIVKAGCVSGGSVCLQKTHAECIGSADARLFEGKNAVDSLRAVLVALAQSAESEEVTRTSDTGERELTLRIERIWTVPSRQMRCVMTLVSALVILGCAQQNLAFSPARAYLAQLLDGSFEHDFFTLLSLDTFSNFIRERASRIDTYETLVVVATQVTGASKFIFAALLLLALLWSLYGVEQLDVGICFEGGAARRRDPHAPHTARRRESAEREDLDMDRAERLWRVSRVRARRWTGSGGMRLRTLDTTCLGAHIENALVAEGIRYNVDDVFCAIPQANTRRLRSQIATLNTSIVDWWRRPS